MHRVAAAAALLAVALGCGGLGRSVEPRAHLDRVCAALPPVHLPDDLGRVPITGGAAVPPGLVIEVRRDGVLAGGFAAPGDELVEAVRRYLPGGRDPVAVVLVDPELPASAGIDVLVAVREAGIARVAIVGDSGEPWDLPAPPVPELADEVQAELAGADPATRALRLADRMADALIACPGATKVFAAISLAAPAHRCALLAQGLDETLPVCFATHSDRVVTLAQLVLAPAAATRPAVLEVTLDPAGPRIELGAEARWADLVRRLDQERPQTAWLERQLPGRGM